MTNAQARYTYSRDTDGCFDLWSIYAPSEDRWFACIRFWDEPDTNEAAETEAQARHIVAALNACRGIPTEALEQGIVKELVDTLDFFFNIMHDYRSSVEKGYIQLAMQRSNAAITRTRERTV
ncbi:MAG: hypothetical protein HY040_07550 [Planctomycetes bacterium]|nr:hypothetical protein [Planctomycetota bacterium]